VNCEIMIEVALKVKSTFLTLHYLLDLPSLKLTTATTLYPSVKSIHNDKLI